MRDNHLNNSPDKAPNDSVGNLGPSPKADSKPVSSGITVNTEFGRELLALRNQAIADGMTLLSHEEIMAEIAAPEFNKT